MTKALDDVAAERERQKAVEGWTEAHDDGHDDQSLAQAAACYALPWKARVTKLDGTPNLPGQRKVRLEIPALWPASWAAVYWKPSDRRRNLVKAGALILAEIERLDRITV